MDQKWIGHKTVGYTACFWTGKKSAILDHLRRATQEKVSRGEGKLPQTMGRVNR